MLTKIEQFFNYWHKVQVYRVWLVNFSLSFITSTWFTYSLDLNIYEESNLLNELTKILSHPIISISAGQSLDTFIVIAFFFSGVLSQHFYDLIWIEGFYWTQSSETHCQFNVFGKENVFLGIFSMSEKHQTGKQIIFAFFVPVNDRMIKSVFQGH